MKSTVIVLAITLTIFFGLTAIAEDQSYRERQLREDINRDVQKWGQLYNETHTNPKPNNEMFQHKVQEEKQLYNEIRRERQELDRIRQR